MEILGQLVQFIKEIFSWWFTVTPWEQAVFVRLGKNIKVLNSGFYFKIPFIDKVYIQSVRLRVVDLPMQTITTKDGVTITLKMMLKYSITDIYKLYNSISMPDSTLAGIIMAKIATYLREVTSTEISFIVLENDVNNILKASNFGLGNLEVNITSWAIVKTFRILQDQSWVFEGLDVSHSIK